MPPAIPTGLKGSIDSTGIVRLSWRLGPEPNIIGYRIVWSNDPSHEFSMRTNQAIADTMFIDSITINTLTRNIYYRVIAVNARKIFSKPSAMLTLRRPDIVPPESPIFTDVRVTDSTVGLIWSPSKSADVRFHRLSRRGPDDDRWTEVAELGREANSFIDRKVIQRTTYEYQIEAIDSSGLHSRPSPLVTARPFDTGVRPAVENLKADKDIRTKKITLSWQYRPRRKETLWFVIYRAMGTASLMELASVDGAKRSYEDDRATTAGLYRYAVKVRGQGGVESPLSAPVSVTQ